MSGGIEIRGLGVEFPGRRVFDGFDMVFPENAVSVLLGGSGVGKTTLLNAVAGLTPYTGEMTLPEGGVSYIFQKDRLIPQLSVYKNLDLVLKGIVRDKAERKRRITLMLEKLEIGSEAAKLPRELSGGQAQRVSVARAFLFPAPVLLMDEPFRALDIGLKFRLLDALAGLLGESPRTVIYVTHDPDECMYAADFWTVLSGSPAKVAGRGEITIPRGARDPASQVMAAERARLLSLLRDGAEE